MSYVTKREIASFAGGNWDGIDDDGALDIVSWVAFHPGGRGFKSRRRASRM
jgi:hypothetical protein